MRSELAYTLRKIEPEAQVTEADNATTALAAFGEQSFDVVFADVHMPGLNGLEMMAVINRLAQRPHIVVVTAHEEHAVSAFELAATDYLLKPVSEERLTQTLERIRATAEPAGEKPRIGAWRLPADDEGRTVLLRFGEVRFVHADGHTVVVHTFERSYRYRGSLAECAARLEVGGFLRVHRSYLVNPEHVAEVSPYFGGT